MASFEIISDITDEEVIAIGNSIRDLSRLRKLYGDGRWRKMKGTALIQLSNNVSAKPKFTGMKHTASDEKSSSAKVTWTKIMKTTKSTPRFAICVDNSEYPASLELHKIYRVLPDKDAQADGDMRIIDESGEDYFIALPQNSLFGSLKTHRDIPRYGLNRYTVFTCVSCYAI
jgi:hypothetical protein